MRVTIDRFEGQYAICEKDNKEMIHINMDNLPKEAKEGDVLIIQGDEISIDHEETEDRQERIKRLMDNLWE